MKTLTYKDAAWGLLGQAVEELGEGDCRQASEKGWGAAAQMVKAVAESRGWKHNSHVNLLSIIDEIVLETGDEEIGNRFSVAGFLHQNFYENWASPTYVGRGLQDVHKLLVRLEAPDVLGDGA